VHAAQLAGEARLEQREPHRAGNLTQRVDDELRVHPANELLFAVDKGREGARHEIDLEARVIELGLEPGVVEVLVERVELVQRVVVEFGGRCGVHAPQQVAVARGLLDAPRRGGVAVGLAHRVVALGRAAPRADVAGLPRHEALRLEHHEVIPHGVLVQARAGRELTQQQAGLGLDLGEQSQTTGLGESPEVLRTAGHEPIITDDPAVASGPWSRIVSRVSYLAVVVTVSDRSARGERPDAAGPVAVEAARSAGFACDAARIVPDGAAAVSGALRAALADGARLIVTTGGTGVSRRDETPEGTAPLLSRSLPGIPEELRRLGATEAPGGLLSRGLAGVVDPGELSNEGALVVNLPGSPRAVASGMSIVLALAPHVLDQLAGGDHS